MSAERKKSAPESKKPDDHHEIALPYDPVALGNILYEVSTKAQPLLHDFFKKYEISLDDTDLDPMNLRQSYLQFLAHLYANPQKLFEQQLKLWKNWVDLWQDSTRRFLEEKHKTNTKPLYEPEPGDRRFRAPEWHESALFDFIKQSYLLTGKWMHDLVTETEGLDDETRAKVDFYTRQYINAMSPTNFLLTNPEVLRETMESGGENLVKGLENLLEDLERGHGKLAISTTDYKAFKVGENLATTPGKVIYQNELMQLIQYEAQTDKVFKRPLLLVPPWINKYYILDLRPDNSFIKWLTQQGHTVFVISWVNPNRKLAKKRFEDYMEQGIMESLRQIETITGEPDCNLIGYCLGGTLLTITLGWIAAQKMKNPIKSATFLTTLVDFEHAGEIKLFLDDHQLDLLDKKMAEHGVLEAESIKRTFSLLRANDLIWSFVVNNYLMGKEPFPFDLLYWNDDSTNMPAAMHSFYLRKLYRDNLLVVPGGIAMNKTPIDITKIDTPSYFLSTREDHIAPWRATYKTPLHFEGKSTFTLAASGHIAGVINAPDKKKYCYWTSSKLPEDPDQWFDKASQHEGSWWPHWQKWIEDYTGPQVKARKIGSSKLKPIEDAPGRYVKAKAD